MSKDKQTAKTGTTEWLLDSLYHRWQIVRRDREYIEFCENKHFDEHGILDDLFGDLELERHKKKAVNRLNRLTALPSSSDLKCHKTVTSQNPTF